METKFLMYRSYLFMVGKFCSDDEMKPHYLYDLPLLFICVSFVPPKIISMKTLLAIDISKHQGFTEWTATSKD